MLYTINTPRGAKTNQTVEIDFGDAKSLRLFLFFVTFNHDFCFFFLAYIDYRPEVASRGCRRIITPE